MQEISNNIYPIILIISHLFIVSTTKIQIKGLLLLVTGFHSNLNPDGYQGE